MQLPWRQRRLASKGPWQSKPQLEGSRHEFYACGTSPWRCKHCMRVLHNWSSPERLKPCGRLTPSMQQLVAHASTHSLRTCVIERGPAVLIYCESCGAYASTGPRGLAKECLGKEHGVVDRQRVLDRIADGKHPWTSDKRLVGESWPVQNELPGL